MAENVLIAPNLDKIEMGTLKIVFNTADRLGKILRIHLVLEQQIDHLLMTMGILESSNSANFHTKTLLLKALRIPKNCIDAVVATNAVRNHLAHLKTNSENIIAKRIDEVIKDPGFTSGPNGTKGCSDDFEFKLGEQKYIFGEMSKDDQFALSVLCLACEIGAMAHHFLFLPPVPNPNALTKQTDEKG